ncbi:efflux RND transporter periplasmic adaptor subunit [Lentibacter sp. XHP0401]|uniref:efflux RND transporter periplasmic adaptor subunit n=1 Tax=Lentibacter sp. XHP0401 TaxID=2984334 RepID=UPI0021E86806|nr:efflux RND transporter periplasmic adaptor subunit [Lentibacter sp. XHP0401]MCV2892868.1 efflux RND transporter periplasmic adaptor subunit [Lentibacter sp. XHP0401]
MPQLFTAPLGRFSATLFLALSLPLSAFAQEGRPPVPVTVVTLEAHDVTLTAPLPGRVAASSEAQVRPQVNGIIRERLYVEGRPVAKGDLLYRIDAASYEAQKTSAEALLAQANASLRSAQRELDRQQELKSRNVVSQQNLDNAISAREISSASVKVAEAQLLATEIDLERTAVRAPIAGVVGLSEVSVGALVTSGQATPLTIIRALDPVHVDVTQAAADILRWRRADGGAEFAEELGQVVQLKLADGTIYEHQGELSAAEPHVNEGTGTILLRLSFPNPEGFLLPGMYVQVDMPQGVVKDAILVPQQAVTRDRRGEPTALVVNEENVVEQRKLTVLRDHGEDWVVTAGVSAGDRIIVAGLQKTAAGATVAPQEQEAEEPSAENN